jgi:hypothetical protein
MFCTSVSSCVGTHFAKQTSSLDMSESVAVNTITEALCQIYEGILFDVLLGKSLRNLVRKAHLTHREKERRNDSRLEVFRHTYFIKLSP